MKTLKRALMTPSVLALPYFGGHLYLDTEACNVQGDSVLLQKQLGDPKKPIAYWFQTPTDKEQRYGTTQRECLQVVWSARLLCLYPKEIVSHYALTTTPSCGSSSLQILPENSINGA